MLVLEYISKATADKEIRTQMAVTVIVSITLFLADMANIDFIIHHRRLFTNRLHIAYASKKIRVHTDFGNDYVVEELAKWMSLFNSSSTLALLIVQFF